MKRDPTTGKDIKDTIYAMKRLSKEKIVTHQVNLDMLWLERDILIAASEKLKSNFLCQLYWAFQNEVEVFLVMEFLQGGDLRFQMRTKENLNKQRPLAENIARFYAAEILLALNDLHNVRDHWDFNYGARFVVHMLSLGKESLLLMNLAGDFFISYLSFLNILCI